jgi:hypothetical protein
MAPAETHAGGFSHREEPNFEKEIWNYTGNSRQIRVKTVKRRRPHSCVFGNYIAPVGSNFLSFYGLMVYYHAKLGRYNKTMQK